MGKSGAGDEPFYNVLASAIADVEVVEADTKKTPDPFGPGA
jgi:hypothetical protein